ncbi:hypothetical protein SCHPADRAFT_687700 [Schizopora paradoxa]|uniref:BTB domain-containing protein n=1 Tax=Schizopora paradoxa TaxID=27342 RepID=A0A0H2R5B3_9AGAM|nr:hypothetical protein SCHPADRAFT_687700 [Schizopora paradoxa]
MSLSNGIISGAQIASTKWDKSFAFDDGDLVLQSTDSINFRVHSVILKLSSSVFRDMLAIPQASSSEPKSTSTDEPIVLAECANVVRILLNIIYPVQHTIDEEAIETLELLNSSITAAIKYDMPAVIQALRAFIRAQTRSTQPKFHPVALYGSAWNFGFGEEAKALSAKTLSYNLDTPEIYGYLKKVDSEGMLKLLILHRRRKLLMLNALNSMTDDPPFAPDVSDVNGPVNVPHLPGEDHCLKLNGNVMSLSPRPADYKSDAKHAWMNFKYELSKWMEERPDGQEFTKIGCDFVFDHRFSDVKYLVDLRVLQKEIARIVEKLPTEIDIEESPSLKRED